MPLKQSVNARNSEASVSDTNSMRRQFGGGDARLNILQIVPALELGGVETYVCRLARGLIERGHRVSILTHGGMLEKLLPPEACLIRAPDRSLARMLPKVANERFDIVNAHNYEPGARFALALSRRTGSPYLMTVHGPRSFLFRARFRSWSRRVLVLSEGDRDNVSSSPGMDSDRLSLSFYGIDTDRFRPGIDSAELRSDFGISAGVPVVVHVSRFSHRKALVVRALLDAFPRLSELQPDLVALIVGGGPLLARVQERAEAINQRLGRCAVIVSPPCLAIPEIMNMATVVVATANTAMEAISCGAPTIAAGRTGYFGLVTPDNFEDARSLCFADHGRSPHLVRSEPLELDLRMVLQNPSRQAKSAGICRSLIEMRYSVSRMAEDVERVYREVIWSERSMAESQGTV